YQVVWDDHEYVVAESADSVWVETDLLEPDDGRATKRHRSHKTFCDICALFVAVSFYRRCSQLAASVSTNCSLAPAPVARLVGNSATFAESASEKLVSARSFEKINLS